MNNIFMSLRCFTAIFLLFSFVNVPSFALDIPGLFQICTEDSGNTVEAKGRIEWVKKCNPEEIVRVYDYQYSGSATNDQDKINTVTDSWLYEMVWINGEPQKIERVLPKFPTFLKKDPTGTLVNSENYYAPKNATDDCVALPTDYHIIGICRAIMD